MITDRTILTELTPAERKGAYSVTRKLKGIGVDMVKQIVQAQTFFEQARKKANEGRKAALQGLSEVYLLLGAAYRSDSDFDTLWAALEIKAPCKRRKKPLIMIVRTLLGGDDKRASKLAQVLKLAFQDMVSPDNFFAYVDELGGIEKAVEKYRVLRRKSSAESTNGRGSAVRQAKELPKEQKEVRREKLQEKVPQETVAHVDAGDPRSNGSAVLVRGNNSGESAGLPIVLGEGWDGLNKTIARAIKKKKKIWKVVEIEIRANGSIDLNSVIRDRRIVKAASENRKELDRLLKTKIPPHLLRKMKLRRRVLAGSLRRKR